MSFVREEDIMAAVESMVTAVSRVAAPDWPMLATPFPRFTYEEAMARYGTDKPDLRFGMELVDLAEAVAETEFRVFSEALAAGGAVYGIRVPGSSTYSRRQIDELTELARRHGAGGLVHLAVEADGALHGPAAKFLGSGESGIRGAMAAEPGDLILIVADANRITAAGALGHLRLELGERLGMRDPRLLAYAWVHRFPMFTWDAEGMRWDATHNPFSAPVWEEEDRLESDPGGVHAQQYDLALNGWELGGGSIRIHRRDLLERAFALMGHSIEGMRDQFGALLDALEVGAPPHGGIALGLDRWAALLTNQSNIREVMSFPKTQSGSDLMMGAPSPISPAQLAELHLALRPAD
jgi:aspartyl-tRNA synthetase